MRQLRKLMTVAEVAAAIRLSPRTIYRLAECGAIPTQRVRARLLFNSREIRRWLQKQARPEAPLRSRRKRRSKERPPEREAAT